MTADYTRYLKQSLQLALPLAFGATNRGLAGPEKVALA